MSSIIRGYFRLTKSCPINFLFFENGKWMRL